MESQEKKLNQLEEMLQDMETQNNEWAKKYESLEKDLKELKQKFEEHSHNNLDGSRFIENYTPKLGEDGDIVSVGNQGGFASGSVSGVNQFIVYGGSPEIGQATIGNQIERGAMQMLLLPDPNNHLDSFVGQGRSLLQLTKIDIPIKTGETTVKITDVSLKDGEFNNRDAVIMMNDVLSYENAFFSRVVSNTTDSVTFEDPYPKDATLKVLEVHTPVSLGASPARFKELFVSGKKIDGSNRHLILGMGVSGRAAGLYISNGAPTGAAPKGSICMDILNGRMYVYQTSWVGK